MNRVIRIALSARSILGPRISLLVGYFQISRGVFIGKIKKRKEIATTDHQKTRNKYYQ